MNGETVMTTATRQVHPLPAKNSLRTVAVVSSHPFWHALGTVLDSMDHDIVFVEALSHAYTQIKRVMPDLIVVCLSDGDRAACQVLSMLRLDRETARIPILMCTPSTSDDDTECALETSEEGFSRLVPVSMN
jgi:CheY-like chemotaxis protein